VYRIAGGEGGILLSLEDAVGSVENVVRINVRGGPPLQTSLLASRLGKEEKPAFLDRASFIGDIECEELGPFSMEENQTEEKNGNNTELRPIALRR